MSGGSYNYLCYETAEGLIEKGNREWTLEEMRDRLKSMGYDDAAKETDDVLQVVRKVRSALSNGPPPIDAMIGRLRDVWHAVEWRDSNDYSDADVQKAILKYRSTTP
jgi:hypothetical protein